LIIDRGRIVAEGTAAELRSRMAGSPIVRVSLSGNVDARQALASLPGVISVSQESDADETRVRLECATDADPREQIFRTAVTHGWTLRELARERLSIEDVFVRLMRHENESPEAESAPPAAEVVQ
jgi:ABC-2 type transport system ATP-binding protein